MDAFASVENFPDRWPAYKIHLIDRNHETANETHFLARFSRLFKVETVIVLSNRIWSRLVRCTPRNCNRDALSHQFLITEIDRSTVFRMPWRTNSRKMVIVELQEFLSVQARAEEVGLCTMEAIRVAGAASERSTCVYCTKLWWTAEPVPVT